MRRLVLLVAALVFVDTMLYAALTPLLPHFAHELGLSKSRAGVLVAAYAAGALVAGLAGRDRGDAARRRGGRCSIGLTLDGAREPRLRLRRRLLDALRGAPPPGRRQRLHVGGRVRVAARGRAARTARRDDRHARWARRSSARCSARSSARAAALVGRARRLRGARRARRSCSSCGRCGSSRRRPSSRRSRPSVRALRNPAFLARAGLMTLGVAPLRRPRRARAAPSRRRGLGRGRDRRRSGSRAPGSRRCRRRSSGA